VFKCALGVEDGKNIYGVRKEGGSLRWVVPWSYMLGVVVS
jgi:hypothetical protein